VGLKEAALDSPTFRATTSHFDDQIDLIERWLDGFVKAASKLVADVATLESTVNAFLRQSAPPTEISEAVLDHDYTLLAVRRFGEGAREHWNGTFRGIKKYESAVLEPVRSFLNGELRSFKEVRRSLEASQKNFDATISRYSAQGRTKEASSLREDAFQLHEARKSYLKLSMDYCLAAPQLRASLDLLVVRIFSEQFKDMRNGRDASAATFAKVSSDMERVRGWSRQMENSERAFKRELAIARRQLEDTALDMTRPSRELGDYELSAGPFKGSITNPPSGSTKQDGPERGEKQGWLFLKTTVGKPTRTLWVRRWFYVKNGIFGWLVQGLRSGGVEESEKTGVLLCGLKPAENQERRFCFEVKTKDTSIIVQAETQVELSEWIGAFEFAKRKALESPASTGRSAEFDPAFAISPPVAPEFAAQVDTEHRSEDSSSALAPETEGMGLGIVQRASFDVNAARRVSSTDRPPEGTRERLLQKLDIHKRGSNTPQVTQAPLPGGIAGLISASHNAMPVGPAAPQSAGADTPIEGKVIPRRNFTLTLSTLAPNSLANPPAATNLSHTAVVVSGERSVSLSSRPDGSGMPGGILANLWGSSNWGYVNRLGDEPPKPTPVSTHQRSASEAPSPPRAVQQSVDDVAVMDGANETPSGMSALAPLSANSAMGHRKTVSVAAATEADLPSQVARPATSDGQEYPNYYPLSLKAQHAQFQILFPSVPRSEKVVLVFRATWNPNEQQEFPGRIYVTTKEIYFYSHYLGFVLITGVSLSSVSDVTAAPGRDCDFLYLHLKDGTKSESRRRITIHVFLDSLRLLQRRMRYLVHNADSSDPDSLEEVIKTLLKMEVERPERSSSVDSYDELEYGGDATAGGQDSPSRRNRDVKASLRIDGKLYGDAARTGREVQKFQLPRQAVLYAPQGLRTSVSREFNVSAKALFHVMFGDKSAVFQLVYCNRWGDNVTQTPWMKNSNDHFARKFSSEADGTRMQDTQTIDILNDHLCYVVTNHKVPWRLPYSTRFQLTSKMVITHAAKSKCKLAIFQQVNWYKPPTVHYYKNLIEQQAHYNLEADALDLSNVAMDQVAKLGNHSKTHKAVEIFGNVGQQGAVPLIEAKAMPNLGPHLAKSVERQHRTVSLPRLVLGDIVTRIGRAFDMAVDILMAVGKGSLALFTAHTLLVFLLIFSALYNSWNGYRDGALWWHERSASKYMARLGVKPEPVIGKAVFLADIEQFIAPPEADQAHLPLVVVSSGSKTCRATFGEQISSSTSVGGSDTPLYRSREALARHRHDLLVALRVVNRVEKDVVLSEWESWLRSESKKCLRVERFLQRHQTSNGSDKNALSDMDGQLGSGFAEYCDSCRVELAAFTNRTSLV